ncbi:MAG: nucleotidyltransferase family protein [Candidatus Aminicenantales bacterium]
MKQMKTGAVVAAAGLSSRMKAFKPMLPLRDSTIIRTAIAGLRAAGVGTVAVVIGHRAEELREHLAGPAVDFLYNEEYATTDMFRSACIGLSYMKDKSERLFFMPGDVPLFDVRTPALMIAKMEESGSPVVIPAYNGRKGHPILVDNRAIPALVAYKGERGLKGAIAALREKAQVLEVDDRGVIMDADSPEDYRLLLQYANEPETLKRLANR